MRRRKVVERLHTMWLLREVNGWSWKRIAQALGLSHQYIRLLACKHGLARKRKKININVDLTCPECRNENFHYEKETGETICTQCGLVLKQTFSPLQRLGFDATFAHVSNMSYGKSLGSEVGGGMRGLYQVLAKSKGGKEDLGIRARQIRIFQTFNDPPQTRKLLERGSLLLKELGLYSRGEYSQESHVLGESYGAALRKVGTWHFMNKTKIRNYRHLATATFYRPRPVPRLS